MRKVINYLIALKVKSSCHATRFPFAKYVQQNIFIFFLHSESFHFINFINFSFQVISGNKLNATEMLTRDVLTLQLLHIVLTDIYMEISSITFRHALIKLCIRHPLKHHL